MSFFSMNIATTSSAICASPNCLVTPTSILLAQEPDQLRAQGQGGDDRVVCAVGPRGGGSAWACPHDAADLRRWPAAMSPVCRTPATGRDNLDDRS